MLAVKILGIVDIVTAIAIYTNTNLLFLTIPLFIIHLMKGLASVGADIVGKVYGLIDVVSAFIILFHISLPLISIVIILILLFKGVTSLL
ncbi:MAG: hypothetical protein QT00_C0002G0064 [archaeon GW2011_AR5]|nr:MAG: hypothetical protein QT00_C0002G0064 [archaeon GW2011_AR5]